MPSGMSKNDSYEREQAEKALNARMDGVVAEIHKKVDDLTRSLNDLIQQHSKLVGQVSDLKADLTKLTESTKL